MQVFIRIVFVFSFCVLSLYANVQTEAIFTTQEKAWIQAHPLISFGADPSWAPFDYIDEKGEHQGIAKDYLVQIAKISGLKFSLYAKKKWADVMEDIKAQKVDLVSAVYFSKQREEFLHYTHPYLKLSEYIFTLKETEKIKSYADLDGKKIAVVKGYAVESWLREHHPYLKLVIKENLLECIQSLSSAEVFGYIGDLPSSLYLQEKYFFTNIKANRIIIDRDPLDLYMAVRKDYPMLASIISKSLSQISQATREKIFEKYAKASKKQGLRGAFGFGRPPYMYDRSSAKGIEEALVRRALLLRGIKLLEVRQMSIQRGQKILLANPEIDFSVGVLEDEKSGLFYSDKFVKYENVAISRKKDRVQLESIKDLRKYKVIAWLDAYKMLGERFEKEFNPLERSENYQEIFDQGLQHEQFFQKEADVILVDKNIFKWYMNQYKKKYDTAQEYEIHKLFSKPTWVRVAFKDKVLRDEFNQGLKILKERGEYQKIIDAYLKFDLQKQLDLTALIASLSAQYLYENRYDDLLTLMNKLDAIKIIKGVEFISKDSKESLIRLEKKDKKYLKVGSFSWEESKAFMIKKPSYLHKDGRMLHVAEARVYFELNNLEDIEISYIPKLSTFQDIKEYEHIRMIYKMLNLDSEATALSVKEQKWIQEHKQIRFVGDPNWLPYEAFDDNGNYIGIVADYLKEIEEITGLRFERIQTNSWEESVAMMKAKQSDVISETTDSKLREYFDFTKHYLENPIVIIMGTQAKYVDSISQIKDKRVAIIKDYGYVSKIKEAYPTLKFIDVTDIKEGLKLVSSNKADALLATMALGSYNINKGGFANLRIVGKTEFSTSIGYGVQPEMKPLVGILNKAIDILDEGRKQEITKKWIAQKYVEKVDYTLVWQILGVASVFLALFWYWNRQMQKEIGRRKEAEDKLQEANSMMKDSIEFSSMIQQALLPTNESFKKICPDSFALWKPRDIVGGDIYFIEQLRHEKEILMMMIDCTGHGVPGAFVTMLVKAIERNVVGYIKGSQEKVSPAEILAIFNRSVKHLLKQEEKDALSNAGFDAAIVYINKEEDLFIYAGAEIPLFYCNEDDKITYIKAERHSIGYRTSRSDYVFKDHIISLDKIKSFYLSTDGYMDQNGGEKGFPFGRKRFMQCLQESHDISMQAVSKRLEERLQEYQGVYERNDDIAIIGVRLGSLFQPTDGTKEQEVLLSFNGMFCQEKVCEFQDEVENFLEARGEDSRLKEKIFAILTEQMQNIMSYAKDSSGAYESKGEIILGFDKKRQKYFLRSTNRIKNEDTLALQMKLQKVNSLNEIELKEYYRQLRKSGSDKHHKGAGLGFLEMAKRASELIEYNIEKISTTDSLFILSVYI